MDIICKDLCFNYNNDVKVLNNVNFRFNDKEITTITGPSGCGKSTLLNLIAKKLEPTSGSIIYSANPHIAYVYQTNRLVPHLTAKQNIDLVLCKTKIKQDIASYYLEKLDILGSKNSLPRAMSIGMQHRLAIARALAYESNLLLIDEPFTSLDEKSKNVALELLLKVIKEEGRTTLIVTHDNELKNSFNSNNLDLS